MNTSAVFGFVNTLEDVLRRLAPTHAAVGFDPPGPTFRHEAFGAYKSQRQETPEDIRLSTPYIRRIVRAYGMPVLEVMRYEADDVIGTVAGQAAAGGFEVYMMTPDKDYGQLVSERVFQYRPRFGGDYETMGVTEVKAKYGLAEAGQMTDLLGLMGDASDNIPGCPGVGEKTAGKLLAQFGTVENMLAQTARIRGGLRVKVEENAEQIRFSKFLATIVTDVPVQFDAGACLLREPDRAQLTELYRELEFKGFLQKLEGKEVRKAPVQLSMFGDPADAPAAATVEAAGGGEGSPMHIGNTPHVYHLTDTAAKRAELGRRLAACRSFAFDTETDSLDPFTGHLVGISFAVEEGEAWYVPLPEAEEEVRQALEPFAAPLQDGRIMKTGQNIKFDLLFLRQYGIRVAGRLFDTMIAHYLLNPELRHGMDYLSETYLNYRPVALDTLLGAKGKNRLSMRAAAVSRVCEYAAEDADVTLRLRNFFGPKLAAAGLEPLFFDIEMPLVDVLADMEETGVKVDRGALGQIASGLAQTAAALEKELYGLAGQPFNINSARQVGAILFERLHIEADGRKTKTGNYSTGEDVLEKLRNKHPIVGKLLDYRGVRKLLSTYADALPELISPRTGKIHTSFNQTVTVTGRLSSTNPNLQNIPVRNAVGREIRKAFIADNADCVFFSADYSQIELRIMAHLSNDAHMIAAFRSGADVHSATAAKIYRVAPENVTPEMRRKAKTANFGIIYGISTYGLAERLNIPRGEARELIKGYFATYPAVKEYMERSIEVAREKGYVETLFKRKRFLADICSNNAVVRGYAERNAINAPIQGSAADIIKVAMVRIARRFREEGLRSKMILQVHDELNFNVWKDELETVEGIVIAEMEGAVELQVPLIAEHGAGRNWMEAH
jgi:DNA polymerase-1